MFAEVITKREGILKIELTLFTRRNLTLRLRKPRPPYFAGWLGALWYINFTNQQFATFSFLMGRFRTGRSKTTSFSIENDIDLAKTTSFSIENDIFSENDVVFDRKRHIWRKRRRFRSKTTLFWRKRHRFRSKTTLLKSNLWINFVARNQYQTTRWTGHEFPILQMKSDTPNHLRTLWNQNFQFFRRFWSDLRNVMILWWSKSRKKLTSWKNFDFF